ncbi:MAG: hypothetical protein Q7T29_11565 [Gallionella sp.]|nr:hypothetical protein [Gallionella sp.]
MKKPTFLWLALPAAMCMMLGANVSVAADQAQAQQKTQSKAQKPELIYGSQLMTPQERTEYRAKMRSLKTKEEREALRMEHHQQMQERAKAKGKTLPDMPMAQGGGACSGAACGGAAGCGGAGGCCGGMHGGMKHGGAAQEGGAACGAGGCCGGAGGCCGGMHGGMKHGGAAPEGGAACGAGGCCGGMHGGMQHGGAAPEGGTAPQGSTEPQSGVAAGGHSHC